MDQFRSELLAAKASKPLPKAGDPGTKRVTHTASFGDLVWNHPEFQKYRADKSEKKHVGFEIGELSTVRDWSGTGHMSRPYEVDSNRATLTTSTGLTGYQRPSGVVLIDQPVLTISQLFSQAQMSSPTIRFTREASFTNSATALAEEGQFQEATLDLEELDSAAKKTGVIGKCSEEVLEDYEFTRDYVTSRLAFMVQSLEDNHLLNGTGSSNQITGVLNTSGILTTSFATASGPFEALARALNTVRNTGQIEPDTIVMNPADFQNFRLSQNSKNGEFWLGNPGERSGVTIGEFAAAGLIWDKPVVASSAIAQGTALVGNFKQGATLFRRRGVTVQISNTTSDDFQYGRVAFRVDTRFALAVYRPWAFATLTSIPAVP